MKKEILNRIIKQKEPSVSELIDENRSLRRKNRKAYAGLILMTAFGALASYCAFKTSANLKKEHEQNAQLSESVSYLQKDAADLFFKNMDLTDYVEDAGKLAKSMTFYPDMPDSITDLPEEEQEKAKSKSDEENQKAQKKHDEALKTLGVDTNLLYRIQRGPKLAE